MFVGICDRNVLEGVEGRLGPLALKSGRLRRVVQATFGAEMQSLQTAARKAEWICSMMAEVLLPNYEVERR